MVGVDDGVGQCSTSIDWIGHARLDDLEIGRQHITKEVI